MGISLLRQMLFGFAKVCVGDFKTVLQVVRIQSLEDYGKIPFFQNASSVKLQQKGTKNSRMFGCLVSFIFIYSVRTA